jgi:hypothetical protein
MPGTPYERQFIKRFLAREATRIRHTLILEGVLSVTEGVHITITSTPFASTAQEPAEMSPDEYLTVERLAANGLRPQINLRKFHLICKALHIDEIGEFSELARGKLLSVRLVSKTTVDAFEQLLENDGIFLKGS